MRYCKLCVQPDTRPRIRFSDEGICFACLHAIDRRENVDWDERRREIEQIADGAMYADYDCVIGVSGGKDSLVQSLYARDDLDLHCLLVNCAPENITDAGRANLENLRQQGFDMISYKPDPVIMRQLVKDSFYTHGNPVKPTEYPLFAVTFQTAIKYRIPLVIMGENPGVTLGVDDLGDGPDATGITGSYTLADQALDDWLERIDDFWWRAAHFYRFPSRKELWLGGVKKAVYLGHYLPDWSFHNNMAFACANGLVGRADTDSCQTGRLSPFSAVDSDMQIVNQMLKYLKYGFGFVTDEVCYAIRDGRMSREQAIELVKRHDGQCGQRYIAEFCRYIDITAQEFWAVASKCVNPTLFQYDESLGSVPGVKSFTPLFEVGRGLE